MNNRDELAKLLKSERWKRFSYVTRTAPFIVVTYMRALCGVGRGGMRVRLDAEGKPRAWVGIDGCDTCHVKMRKLKEKPAKP